MTASPATERPDAPTETPTARRPTIQWGPALVGAVRKLDPRGLVRQPVVFTVWVGSVFSTVLAVTDPTVFGWLIAVWLWLTVLFANVAEAVAEGRGKAQAASLRALQTETPAQRRTSSGSLETVASTDLRAGDVVLKAGNDRIAAR